MKYDKRDYFKELADPTVNGFTVLETDESEGYNVIEKWQRADDDDRWANYWIEEDELLDRIEKDKCEHVGQVSDEQLEALKDKMETLVDRHPDVRAMP